METSGIQLAASIARWTSPGVKAATIPGLGLYRRSGTTLPMNTVYGPRVCVIAQGAKRVMVGEESLLYDAQNYLVSSVHLPSTVQIVKASPDWPYLGLILELDRRELSQLMVDSRLPAPPKSLLPGCGMATAPLTPQLLSAFQRLLDLLETPQDIPILAPIIKKEIFYRLLVGEVGIRLRQIALAGTQLYQLAQIIDWLKSHYDRAFKVHELARQANMSISTFHQQFRHMTTMSPLQFQKWLRLNEARRLMLSESLDATTAAFQVGYVSASQFSREYSRLFGAPPLRDVSRLRTRFQTEDESVQL